ncbi:MAG: sulfatase [Planctomycetota bacterium]
MARPNLLVILMDDLGWADLGCYGSTFYETPRLDRLAAQGVRFTDGYAAAPVCSPTRASLLTGQYPARLNLTNFIPGNATGKLAGPPFRHHLPDGAVTIAGLLRDAGYRTGHIGKWHLGNPRNGHGPLDAGFDRNIAGCSRGLPNNGFFSPYGMPAEANLPDGPDGEYLTDRLTDEAIDELHAAADDNRPFFMHLSHYAVHVPIQAPEPLVEKYRTKAERLGLDRADVIVPGEHFPTRHKADQRIERRIIQSDPAYAAMVENMDTNIGRLLDALDELGMADDTLVLFTSDNGGLATAEGSPTCNAPLSEGKGWTADGGLREPFIMRWPGVTPAGAECGVPVTTPDILPTFASAAGMELPEDLPIDGESLLPLLRSPEVAFDRPGIYWHYPHYSNQGGTPSSAIRAGRWKLIEFYEDDRVELYDLATDIGEARDRAADEPDIAADLRRRLQTWRASVDARYPTPALPPAPPLHTRPE